MSDNIDDYTARMKYMADGRDKLGPMWVHCYAILSPDGEDTGIEFQARGGARREQTRCFIWNGAEFGTLADALAAKGGAA